MLVSLDHLYLHWTLKFYSDIALGEPDEPILLPNVSSSILRKVCCHPEPNQLDSLYGAQVLEYCEHHRGEPLPAADTGSKRAGIFMNISQWDWEFVNVDPDMLLEMILAANYLHIDPLLYVLCPIMIQNNLI